MKVNYYWTEEFIWNLVDSKPVNWEWVHDTSSSFDCYIDNAIFNVKDDNRKKIAIIREPGCWKRERFDFIRKNWNKFNYIFTYERELLDLPNAKFYPGSNIWYISDNKIKTKNCSFCVSNKREPASHLERRKMADKIKNKITLLGDYAGRHCSIKDIYEDFRFSIVWENEQNDTYFSEKLCNAFANRCIPINYGCSDLNKFGFDTNGVIQISKPEQIENLVNGNFNWEEEYNKRLEAIEYNFEAVKKYRRFEDWLYNTYPEIWKELDGNN